MSLISKISEITEIKKGFRCLGLEISESEINAIEMRKSISLQTRTLSEIGSLFILASAISALKLGQKSTSFTFQNLPYLRLPLYSWNCQYFGECCLFLTLINGNPEIIIDSGKL